MTFTLTFSEPRVHSYTTRRDPRARASQHTVTAIPRPFLLPLTRTAAFVLAVLDAIEAVETSEAWWTRMYASLTARYTIIMLSVGLLPAAEEAIDRKIEPEGLQSAGGSGSGSHCAPHTERAGFVAAASKVTKAVEHDAGAVNVVVSGLMFIRLRPEREVAVGMMFACKDFETENQ